MNNQLDKSEKIVKGNSPSDSGALIQRSFRKRKSMACHTIPSFSNRRSSARSSRNGAALVEFAVTCSLAFFFFFAALEFTRVTMFRHTVEQALYEGARKGIIPGATSTDVLNESRAILRRLGIANATVTVTPSVISNATNDVTVRIQLPLDQGFLGPAFFFIGKTLDRTFVMRREGFR